MMIGMVIGMILMITFFYQKMQSPIGYHCLKYLNLNPKNNLNPNQFYEYIPKERRRHQRL